MTTHRNESRPPDVVPVSAGAVLLSGDAVQEIAALVAFGLIELERRNATPAALHARRLVDALTAAAARARTAGVSRARHDDVADNTAQASSGHGTELTTLQVCVQLQLSPRQTQRLAAHLGARRAAGGVLMFPTAAVTAEAHRRRTRPATPPMLTDRRTSP